MVNVVVNPLLSTSCQKCWWSSACTCIVSV